MTREEAINWFEAYLIDYHDPMEAPDDLPYEVAQIALSALTQPTQEQVERVWKGEWRENEFLYRYCSLCDFEFDEPTKSTNFCPGCGAPMTDEAVQMVAERLEALKDGVD